MDFTENLSLLLIAVFFGLFFFLRSRLTTEHMNRFISCSSLVLYGVWFPPFIALITFQTALMFAVSQKISNRSRAIFIGSIALNLGILGFFKYYNFFCAEVFSRPDRTLDILLPIGISFYTFTIIGHLVDLYRGEVKPLKNLSEAVLFTAFWPHLASGPILRSKNMITNMRSRTMLTPDIIALSLTLVTGGLVKKLLFADNLGAYVNWNIEYGVSGMSVLDAWSTLVGYTAQIYFDFSGYSDMAIGFALLIGFRLPANFNYPYEAQSLRDFWTRWHISLSQWFRDYVYLPLGGSRRSLWRTHLNLMIVFFLSGLWHGAGWNFIVWGSIHGIFLVLERLFDPAITKLSRPFRTAITLIIVMSAWSFFRLPVGDAYLLLRKMLHAVPNTTWIGSASPYHLLPLALAVCFLVVDHTLKFYEVAPDGYPTLRIRFGHWVLLPLLFLLSVLLSGQEQPYIYFQF